jgi:hypothetical protein
VGFVAIGRLFECQMAGRGGLPGFERPLCQFGVRCVAAARGLRAWLHPIAKVGGRKGGTHHQKYQKSQMRCLSDIVALMVSKHKTKTIFRTGSAGECRRWHTGPKYIREL